MTLISAVPPVIQFLQSLLLGTLLSLLYDAFYTIRGLFPAQAQPHVILDILYFLLFGVLLFDYLLMESAGRLRYFIILGVIIGWLLYQYSQPVGNPFFQLATADGPPCFFFFIESDHHFGPAAFSFHIHCL